MSNNSFHEAKQRLNRDSPKTKSLSIIVEKQVPKLNLGRPVLVLYWDTSTQMYPPEMKVVTSRYIKNCRKADSCLDLRQTSLL